MNIMELKDQIIKGTMKNFYVFTGDEIGIMKIYLQQMSNKLKLPITRAESVASIYSNCTVRSMFGNTAGLYVIRDDREFMKQEEAYQRIAHDMLPGNVIVLLYDKIDSRLKFGKFFKDQIVQFDKLTPSVLKSYIVKELTLSSENIDTLIDICSGSYDMCMLEVDKIRQYQQYTYRHSQVLPKPDEAFSKLLDCGAIYQSEESDVFKFTDAVCSRNKTLAVQLATLLLENGNSSINLLGTLYNSMKSVMLIQCCDGQNVSEITGLDNRQIYFNKKYVKRYSTSELVKAVRLLASVVSGVKSGKIDDVYATKYALVQIL